MHQFTLRTASDTAYSHEIVPIYLIHTIENPFCPAPSCWCHRDQERIARLLEHVESSEMTLREAADFADGRTV